METHFLKRHKCPKDFVLIEKSVPTNKVRRGWVAVYKICSPDFKFTVFDDICPDAVVLNVQATNTIFIAPYVAPDNSLYKISGIFSFIDSVIIIFPNSHIFLLGDLNSRCGVPASPNVQ